jgi:hypothetical protein
VQSLRRWVPGHARSAVWGVTQPVGERPDEVAEKDIAFCSEFAFHGGVAASATGFKVEAELVRMRRARLLDLERDVAPPFAVTRVTLWSRARGMLSGQCQVSAGGRGKDADEHGSAKPAASLDPKLEQRLRCNGFEVARGMFSAALKAEFASWHAAGAPLATAGLEARILARISQIKAPFSA